MIGLRKLEVHNFIFNIKEKNNKLEHYKIPVSEISGILYRKVINEIEKDLDNSNITATELQDEKLGPIVFEEFREQVTKRMKDDK